MPVKRTIAIRLCVVILLSMVATACLGYSLQIRSAKESAYNSSLVRISQIAQILENNDTEIERLKENLREDYFIRAKAAAYIIQNNPEVVGNLSEIRKIAALLQVDELHLFDTSGRIYAGSEPKYYNYTFHSGEQMEFFLPMLEDTSLQLCQDITPNTAEGKLMQYIAVWREDHQGIVQIGMEPVRLLDALEKNELSHLFPVMTVGEGVTLFAADPQTGNILASTENSLSGESLGSLGLDSLPEENEGVTVQFHGDKQFCVLQPVGQLAIGVATSYDTLMQDIPDNMRQIIVSLCILAAAVIFLILWMLDTYIIRGIHQLIDGMKKITTGNLDTRVAVDSSPEFVELSRSINSMVMSLLETNNRLSLVFQHIDLPIAVYEYTWDMGRVMATSKLGEILLLPEGEVSRILCDREAFEAAIQGFRRLPVPGETDVFQLREGEPHYVKIEIYQEENSTWGILMDVSEEIVEKKQLLLERDRDHLTGLFNRRAFSEEMARLFAQPELVKTAVVLMIDLDNLKFVNDHWGHECGDLLLQRAAQCLKDCDAPLKIAARIGGDEFVLVLYGEEGEEPLRRRLTQLHQQMSSAAIDLPDGQTVLVQLSGGYAFYPAASSNYSQLLRYADQAMYRVKNSTKGRFDEYQPPENP